MLPARPLEKKNYKTLLRNIKIHISCHINYIHILSLIAIRLLIFPKLNYRFKEITLKVLVIFAYVYFCFSMEFGKIIPKFL